MSQDSLIARVLPKALADSVRLIGDDKDAEIATLKAEVARLRAIADEEAERSHSFATAARHVDEQLTRITSTPVGGGCPCRGMGAFVGHDTEWPCPNGCASPRVSLWVNNRQKALRHAQRHAS